MKGTNRSFIIIILCFILLLISSCQGEVASDAKKEYSVYTPDGAPALALSYAFVQDPDNYAFQYHVVDSSTLQGYITGDAPAADFCILPLNLASKILGSGDTYKLVGTVTHGNLFFLTDAGNPVISNLASLVGKTIGVVQLTNIPGLTLEIVFQQAGIPFTTISDIEDIQNDRVNLIAMDATSITPNAGYDYYLCPEPAATTKVKKTDGKLIFAGNLQEMYGEGGYPQAVLVVKTSIAEEDPSAVFLLEDYLEQASSYLTEENIQKIVASLDRFRTDGLSATFTSDNLNADVLRNCAISFESAASEKEKINRFLDELISINENSAANVEDSFFWIK